MDLFTVKNLNFQYPNEEQRILTDVSFCVPKGAFVTICGATGCGKTTLLRLLKKELQPAGELTGELLYCGKQFEAYSEREMAGAVGYVMQNPEHMIVTDKVYSELAFGLENMQVPHAEIRRRVAEVSAYFGIDDWFERQTDELSGGQKQILNLAAILVMRPRVVILDEPTAQLDPIAAENFMQMLRKLHEELGMTILIAEHRLEEVLPLSDLVLVMQHGRICFCGTPQEAAMQVSEQEPVYGAFPAAARAYRRYLKRGDATHPEINCPLTIAQGRAFLETFASNQVLEKSEPERRSGDENPIALQMKRVTFSYEKNAEEVLREVSLTLRYGEVTCLLGSNGSGKTTALKVMAGIWRPLSGSVELDGKKLKKPCPEKIAYLPQDVETVFVSDSVQEEWKMAKNTELFSKVGFDASNYLERHPYDLSGGEKQLLAMGKVLSGGQRICLLDEPTKGLDVQAKKQIGCLIELLRAQGCAVLIVTHDMELAAQYADWCGMFFRGEILELQDTRSFFMENQFYSTGARRLTRGIAEGIVTQEELMHYAEQGGSHENNG